MRAHDEAQQRRLRPHQGLVIDRIAYSPYGEATRTLRSDVNGDGFVNQSDYSGIIRPRNGAAIGTAAYVVEADLDRNGVINQLDYDISIADDGKSSSGGVGEAGLFSRGVRNSIGYCGYIFNEDSGLYTVRFRTYSPTLGRWLERDPAGYVDGMGLYEYVRGGAIDAVDPSGRWTVPTSVMSRTISTVMQWGCGVRIATRVRQGDEKGHGWIEWDEVDPNGNPATRSIGYWPLQLRAVTRPPTPLPAGRFTSSTLYGPSASRVGAVGYIPESCGHADPYQGTAIHEWIAIRRLSPQSYNVGTRYGATRIMNEEYGKRLVTREWLQAGSSVGTRCERASCAEIIDCLRHARPSREWDLLGRELDGFGYTCHDFVRDALRQCCLKVGCKQK
jgi:RHS repeat-associated protein